MKKEEKSAQIFLKNYFKKEPIYEPIQKSSPPDFCIDNIAFEVRRLNQNYVYENGNIEGLEQLTYALGKVYNELKQVPFLPKRGSFWWKIKYARPLPVKVHKIVKDLIKQVCNYYSSNELIACKNFASYGVTIELTPTGKLYKEAFLSTIEIDNDSDGLIRDLYRDNIQIALKDKIEKTKNIKDKFAYWVLVLVDAITPGIAWVDEMKVINFKIQHFTSIVIINQNGIYLMEWPDNSLNTLQMNYQNCNFPEE